MSQLLTAAGMLPYVDACSDGDDLVRRVEHWLFDEVKRTRASSVFVPAGRTPLPLYARWERTKPRELDGLRLCAVDDVVTGPGAGMFARFFASALPSYAGALAPVGDELPEIPGVALLGLGLNGHVAFHEPHVPARFSKGIVELARETCLELALEPPVQGLSYGVGAFRRCQSVAIMVSNSRKRAVLHRLLAADPSMPARWLMDAFVNDPGRASRFRIFAEDTLLRR